ncbi:MAG: large subunit ribosomal protein L25 [Lentimonas sp.]|jgi:large subunit ribosomal protein L25
MQQFKLNVVNRENAGRGVARRLRAEGKIPACVYSKGNSRSISFSAIEFRELRRSISGAALIELTDEKGEIALTHIQEIQRNVIKSSIDHVDFYKVESGETFTAQIPVHLVGESESIGVRNEGGMIDHKTHALEVRCIPSKLPDSIEVDVKDLEVGGAIHISDLKVLEGVEYMDTPSQVIVSCQPPSVFEEVSETAEDSAAAGEVPASKVKSDDADTAKAE